MSLRDMSSSRSRRESKLSKFCLGRKEDSCMDVSNKETGGGAALINKSVRSRRPDQLATFVNPLFDPVDSSESLAQPLSVSSAGDGVIKGGPVRSLHARSHLVAARS